MKYFIAILLYCSALISPVQAQLLLNDSASKAMLKDLNLTKAQKHTTKQLIGEFKLEDRRRRSLLRHRFLCS